MTLRSSFQSPGVSAISHWPMNVSAAGVAVKRWSNSAPSRQMRRTPSVVADAVRAAHAARVEVLHDQAVAGLGRADDADRVREELVVVARAQDQELAAFEPLVGDGRPGRRRRASDAWTRCPRCRSVRRTAAVRDRDRSWKLGRFHVAELIGPVYRRTRHAHAPAGVAVAEARARSRASGTARGGADAARTRQPAHARAARRRAGCRAAPLHAVRPPLNRLLDVRNGRIVPVHGPVGPHDQAASGRIRPLSDRNWPTRSVCMSARSDATRRASSNPSSMSRGKLANALELSLDELAGAPEDPLDGTWWTARQVEVDGRAFDRHRRRAAHEPA